MSGSVLAGTFDSVSSLGSLVASFLGVEWSPSFSSGEEELDSVELGGSPGSVGTSRGP